MTTAEQVQERKDEWDAGKKSSTKKYTHGMRRRQALARSMMPSLDEAGVWSGDMKTEANAHAIALMHRRILHQLLGEVVVVKDMGEAQALPEDGPPVRWRSSTTTSLRRAICAWIWPKPWTIYKKAWRG